MIDDIVSAYIKLFPDERAKLALLVEQIAAEDVLNNRRNFSGHITGSAIVLSPDKKKVLLIHHKQFNRWMQPGGHWESDEEANPLEAAKREVVEETGVALAENVPVDPTQPLLPLIIDSHLVTARPERDEPAHFHHDFRYVFIAKSETLKHQAAEVNAAAWFDLDAPETDNIRSAITKLQQRKLIRT